MAVGDLREASVSRGHRIRRFLGSRAALWLAFALVHARAHLAEPRRRRGYPLGDVTGVYRVWAENAADGYVRMGIDAPWVYPILAFAPMAASLAFGSEWYGQTWLAIVVLLDAAAFAILLGDRRLSRTRRIAAWWWLGFLALLGPIALGRLDAVTVPLALTGLLWAAGRPRVAAVLLTIGAWVKVWPAALLASLVIASRKRWDVITVAVALSVGILGVSLLAGSGLNALGFVAEQAGRGLQIEAPARRRVAVADRRGVASRRDRLRPRDPHVPDLGSGGGCRGRPHDAGDGGRAWRSSCSSASGPCGAARPSDDCSRALALSFVVVLMLANKVGSPQFVTWLAAPIILGLVLAAAPIRWCRRRSPPRSPSSRTCSTRTCTGGCSWRIRRSCCSSR